METTLVPQGKCRESKSNHLPRWWQLPNPQEGCDEMKSMIPLSKCFD